MEACISIRSADPRDRALLQQSAGLRVVVRGMDREATPGRTDRPSGLLLKKI